MFDTLPPEPEALSHADDATVVAAIEEWGRIETAAGARRLDAIAELVRRRSNGDAERAHWACDYWDAAAAEVAAALSVGRRQASWQMSLSLTLRHRLPKVAALLLDGRLSARVVSAITWRTRLVEDEDALRQIDGALAERAIRWGSLADLKLEQAIDVWVDQFDPGALRRTRDKARSRDVCFGDRTDTEAGTRAMWGRLYATDAQLLDRRLREMAYAVCDEDPRTIAQRRADALGALAAGSDRLACACGAPECPNAESDGRAAGVVIHVVAEESAISDEPDPHMNGEWSDAKPEAAQPRSGKPSAALLMSGGIVPTPLLAELINSGAKLRPLRDLTDMPAEARYQPSAALQEFVRCRDLTCRFPGCKEPAEFCDIDHTIPYPVGLTHPSNLKCVCRKHHLLKTFWSGIDGWADQQLPDGTVVWTAPTGQPYTTKPGGKLFFPRWNTTTAKLSLPQAVSPVSGRGVMMPRRRRTRAADRARRIQEERALNDVHVAERNRPPPF